MISIWAKIAKVHSLFAHKLTQCNIPRYNSVMCYTFSTILGIKVGLCKFCKQLQVQQTLLLWLDQQRRSNCRIPLPGNSKQPRKNWQQCLRSPFPCFIYGFIVHSLNYFSSQYRPSGYYHDGNDIYFLAIA